jgi:hypothetical protein
VGTSRGGGRGLNGPLAVNAGGWAAFQSTSDACPARTSPPRGTVVQGYALAHCMTGRVQWGV